MTKKVKCAYADKYKATRKPTCGCKTCERRWEAKRIVDLVRGNTALEGIEIRKEFYEEMIERTIEDLKRENGE